MKLYNRLFTQEEFKYLPPKFSYALKDLATDLGIFERADVSSIISGGSTSLSMTTTSGFNLNFNNTNGSSGPSDPALMMLKNEREGSFPLSPIKEQPGKQNMQYSSVNQSMRTSQTKPLSQSNGPNNRFRNASQTSNHQEMILPPANSRAGMQQVPPVARVGRGYVASNKPSSK